MTKIDNDTAKKVMDILSNPDMMRKISAIASSTSAPQPREEPASEPPTPTPQIVSTPTTDGNKTDLLLAIKPLLKTEKQGKIDAIIKALTVATTISKLKGGGNNV